MFWWSRSGGYTSYIIWNIIGRCYHEYILHNKRFITHHREKYYISLCSKPEGRFLCYSLMWQERVVWQGMRKSQNKAVLLSLSPLVSGQCPGRGHHWICGGFKKNKRQTEVEFTPPLWAVLRMGSESSCCSWHSWFSKHRLRLESIPALRFSKLHPLTFLGSPSLQMPDWDWLIHHHKSISL